MSEFKCANCARPIDFAERYYCNDVCQAQWYAQYNAIQLLKREPAWITPAGGIRTLSE